MWSLAALGLAGGFQQRDRLQSYDVEIVNGNVISWCYMIS